MKRNASLLSGRVSLWYNENMKALTHIAERVPAILEKASGTERGPGIILIEEIWGLTPHIADVAKRFAQEGFEVIAPELLDESGVLEKIDQSVFAQMHSEDEAVRTAAQALMRDAIAPIRSADFARGAVGKLKLVYDELAKISSGNIAAVGFCFGGSYAFHLAANEPGLKAAVPFYGQPPSDEEIKNIECPILAFYGEEDKPLMETLPKLKENMTSAGKAFEAIVYEGAGHAFFNDTNSIAYREQLAQDAWQRTLAFLRKNLS
jgi:carboxymethylenebutenolidase